MENTLTKEKEDIVKHISDLQNSCIYYLNQNLERLQQENKALCERTETVIRKDDLLHNEYNALSYEISALKKENSTLQTSNHALSSEIGILQASIRALKSEIGTLQTSNRALNNEIGSLHTEKQALNVKLADLTKRSESFEEQYLSLNEKHNEAASDLKLAKETNDQLQNRIAALQQNLSDMENSGSWKFTKPLRAIKQLFLRNGK